MSNRNSWLIPPQYRAETFNNPESAKAMTKPQTQKPRIVDPAVKLARLVSVELGVSVFEKDIERLIRGNWFELQAYAHAVHDDLDRVGKNININPKENSREDDWSRSFPDSDGRD